MEQPILEWALAVIGSGGIGAVITYICTFKSKKKQVEAEAESSMVDVEQKKRTSNKTSMIICRRRVIGT